MTRRWIFCLCAAVLVAGFALHAIYGAASTCDALSALPWVAC